MKHRCANLVLFGGLCCPPLLAAENSSTIEVIGKRDETSRPTGPGKTIHIRPQEASRFDSKVQLKEDAQIVFRNTGRLTSSGFAIPHIRGQDAKLTNIFLEDHHLQDPMSALPLALDLDLHAFGRLDLYQGLAPYSIANSTPIGTIRYRRVPLKRKVGAAIGRPYGEAVWGLAGNVKKWSSSEFENRLYLRQHRSTGRYTYYDDNGTRYNDRDDGVAIRQNNDRLARQAAPQFRYQNGPWQLDLLNLIQTSQAGLPGPNNQPGLAREATRDAIQLGSVEYASSPHHRTKLLFKNGRHKRDVDDPDGDLLGFAGQNKLHSRIGSVGMSHKWQAERFDLFARFDHMQNRTDTDFATTQTLKRQSDQLYLGSWIELTPQVSAELKASDGQVRDQIGDDITELCNRARGLSLLWHHRQFSAYGQLATANRLPSLFETFGDGAYVLPADKLTPEDMVHREVGVAYKTQNLHLGAGYFVDDSHNKIRFLPSIGQTVRAMNLDHTLVKGWDLHTSYRADRWSAGVSGSILNSQDFAFADGKELVNTPQRRLAAQISTWMYGFTWRWDSRYRSQTYRDRANTIVVPEATIHGSSLDYRIQQGKWDGSVGLRVDNITDVKKIAIAAPETPTNKGATGYSDYQGFPLPGRQWKLSVGVEW